MVKQVQDIERSCVIHFPDDFANATTDTRTLAMLATETTCWISYYELGAFLHSRKPLYSLLTMVGMVDDKRVVVTLWNPTGAYGLHMDLLTKEQVDLLLRDVVNGDEGFGVTAIFGDVNPNVTYMVNHLTKQARDQYFAVARLMGISKDVVHNTVMYIGEPVDNLGATFH